MRTIHLSVLCVCAIGVAGCATCGPDAPRAGADRAVMEAPYTAIPVRVDGKLDDPVWQNAPRYEFSLGGDELEKGNVLEERGEARLAWDDRFLYLAVTFVDSDIVAEADEDQVHHYRTGDLAELFLKPASNTWYWELYVTPHQRKTHLWFPGRGRLGVPSSDAYEMELHVAAQCDGTLNDWQDKDNRWTGEMAVPIAELTRHGDAFGPGQAWTILVARYNYSRYLGHYGPELSMTPKLPVTAYHHLEGYAALRLTR